jgi:hypothetical protein
MKTGAAMLALTLATGAARAEGDDWRQKCKNYESLAETVMEKRQAGIAVSRMMEVAGEDALIQDLVERAYDQPRYSTDRMIRRTIEDFRNQAYMACLKAYKAEASAAAGTE